MTKEKAVKVLEELTRLYPEARAELHFSNPFETLIATILSAQCTDRRVNMVTETLFRDYPNAAALGALTQPQLEARIKECGLYRMKAANILAACHELTEKYGGQVPNTREALMALPGVGQKTAGVVLMAAFQDDQIPVDTHVFRLAHRLGLSDGKTPEAVEKDLRAVIPEKYYTRAHHLLIFHGRYTCKSRRPECDKCMVKEYCVNPDFHS